VYAYLSYDSQRWEIKSVAGNDASDRALPLKVTAARVSVGRIVLIVRQSLLIKSLS
jgi:hypothetical protein